MPMTREADLEQLYDGLTVFARRARELSTELHPGLSLGAFTMLSYIDNRPDIRASDIAAEWGLVAQHSRAINPHPAIPPIARLDRQRHRRLCPPDHPLQ